jgi:hypothetical protein
VGIHSKRCISLLLLLLLLLQHFDAHQPLPPTHTGTC